MGLSRKLLDHEVRHFDFLSFLKHHFNGRKISSAPVFIVGCGHSGTTMLRHVLGLHPSIYAVPYESRIFFHSAFKRKLAETIWNMTSVSLGKSRWLEKTPAHIYRIEQILRAYPDARILLLIRDGRNVAVSLCKRWGNFERSVQRWVDDNRAGEPFWNHLQVKKLCYEQLVADFENQISEIFEFIGEPLDGAVLSFSKSNTAEEASVRPFDDDGAQPRQLRDKQIGRGLYNDQEKWLSQMSPEEKSFFKQRAGEMLVEYGYAEDNDW